jgi:hypothetical protein
VLTLVFTIADVSGKSFVGDRPPGKTDGLATAPEVVGPAVASIVAGEESAPEA